MKAIARYLGFGVDEDDVTPLRLMRSELTEPLPRALVATVVFIGAAILAFDWRPAPTVIGTAVGAAGAYAIAYLAEARSRLPSGPLRPVPPDAAWAVRGRPDRDAIVATVVAFSGMILGLRWIGHNDLEVLGAMLVPGPLIGYQLASLVIAGRVARWEQDNGVQIAYRYDGGELQRFAVDPLRVQ